MIGAVMDDTSPPASTTPPTPDAKGYRPVIELRVALTTGDYERLVSFYCDALGIEPEQLWTSDHDQGRAVILDMGKGTLEIFDEKHATTIDLIEAGARVSGQIRFALRVPDLQAAIDRLISKGVSIVHPPVVTPWGHHNVRLQDPDGMQVTLFQILYQQ
jgi:catechol 2,3-dioxygenase-like lactoylglutathione lyase family enzyme